MPDLLTSYMGLKLKNPIIASSSTLTKDVAKIKKLEEAGCGAVVLKSLFEEQIIADNKEVMDTAFAGYHSETWDYVRRTSMQKYGPEDYIELIKDAKGEVNIPVIASLHCTSQEWWGEYAAKIEAAGADALELNISFITGDLNVASSDIEQKYIDVVKYVKSNTKLPIAVKIGQYFTAPAKFCYELQKAGAYSIVIFNRFYQIDIDVDKMALTSKMILSDEKDIASSLRWVSMLSGRIKCDICGASAIHTGKDVIKYLLAGANAVQVCSVLYKHGIEAVSTIIKEVEAWMKDNSYQTIDDFRASLSQEESENPEQYERLQYIKAIVGIE